ncbi:hypothetical protein TVAG_472490 [Trichomonas vaginalis G3]|uniref:Uncharacterized protein n=1 Tax=Trichomonas vaginalis (strain ATCC PRA-98 / G3) TaxID=412133 RepID=A2G6N6_TRIV3|nr:biological adhesion protein [Trichomonas vaginalis G3]EAX87179.1 hypothetical protein TVAG_472490 [Trichomonas vaginalis G3]KAI5543895.1 biological adhesion protein [Trichomonas vaginalis G3]|eukprot:XP_001300109.1 hypothetical protein [Trichomonas vaginalis G3]
MDSHDEYQTDSTLSDKIHQMSIEIDSLKASRNYYKDQCETLFVSLSKTVTDQTPSYRTQKEVEETISKIKAQEAEKNKILKQRYKEREKIYQNEIIKLQDTIRHHERIIDNQKNARTELIEQLMSYKKRLTTSESKLKDAESTLEQIKLSRSSIQINSQQSQLINNSNTLKEGNTNEISLLKRKIVKYAKQIEEMRTSVELSQSLNDDTIKENKSMKIKISEQESIINELKKMNESQKQQVIDSQSLLVNAIKEVELLQSDVESAQSTIDLLVKRLYEKESEFNSYVQEIATRIAENNQQKSSIKDGSTTIINLQSQIQTYIQQITELKQTIEINQNTTQTQVTTFNNQISSLKSTIDSQSNQIEDFNKKIQSLQSELLAEKRLRKAAEVAKEAAVTNLKNAYALLAANENTRNESTAEIDRITTEMTTKNKDIEEKDATIKNLTEELKQTVEKLNNSVSSEANLRDKLKEVNDKYIHMQENSILREEAQKAIDAVADERDKAIESRHQIEIDHSTCLNELNDLKIAFSHQESTIAALQNEVKSLTNANKNLRSKLLNGEEISEISETNEISNVTTSRLLDNQDDLEKGMVISEIKSQLELTQKQSIKDQTTIQGLRNEIENIKKSLIEFADSFKEFANYVPSIGESHQRLMMKIKKIDDINIAIKIISQFIVDSFDECVRFSKNTTQSTEGTLLRSSIYHLTRKIDSLQQQNAAQAQDINTLQQNIQAVYSNKEKCEDELQSFTKTITSLRVTLDATSKKLQESETEKKKLRQELKSVPSIVSTQQKDESSFSDSLNLSEISSLDEDDLKTIVNESEHNETRGKNHPSESATALADSLAMLDLICQ